MEGKEGDSAVLPESCVNTINRILVYQKKKNPTLGMNVGRGREICVYHCRDVEVQLFCVFPIQKEQAKPSDVDEQLK